jgi:dolichyl-phosphate-mannose--protein O-mannosyl transferase
LCPLLFFLLLYVAVPNIHCAALFTSLCLFDNALIVQSRTASLEGMQLFFILLTLLCFTYMVTRKRFAWGLYILLGGLMTAAVGIKLTSAILCILPIAAGIAHYRAGRNWKRAAAGACVTIGVAVLCFFVIAKVHSLLIVPEKLNLPQEKLEYLSSMSTMNPAAYGRLNKIMPPYDTNSSHPFSWPFGHRSIIYRWATDMDTSRFIYLQGNPAAWNVGLVAVLLGTALILSRYVFGFKPQHGSIFNAIQVYMLLYFAYMITLSFANRIMYLSYYIVPLVLSFVVAYLIFVYLFSAYIDRKNTLIYVALIIYCAQLITVYLFFSPISYYRDIARREFNRRAWSRLWDLKYDTER